MASSSSITRRQVILINRIISMLNLNILIVYLIPKTTSNKINSLFARSLWDGSRDFKPMFWKSMRTLELPKGDCSLTNILDDKWQRGGPIKIKQGITLEEFGVWRVKDLMISNQKTWSHNLIRQIFTTDTAIRILSTHIPNEDLQDTFA